MVGSSLPTHRELVDALEALADAVLKSEGIPRPLVALSEDARNRARQYKTDLAEKLVREGASRVPLSHATTFRGAPRPPHPQRS